MEEKSKVYILNLRRVVEVNFAVLALQRGLNVMDCDAQVTWGHSKDFSTAHTFRRAS